MTIYLIIFILATIGVALIFNTELSKNKLYKYGSVILYFILIELFLGLVTESITIPVVLLGILLLVSLIGAIIGASFFAARKSNILKYIFNFVFLLAVLGVTYALYDSIMDPIRFDQEKEKRYTAAVKELLTIKKSQILYKKEKGKYTNSFEDLRKFLSEDSITFIKKEGSIPDSIYLQSGNNMELAEKTALKYKMIIRDTIRVSIKDTLFSNYDINRLGYVPFTENLLFDMDTATIETGGMKVNVFEARVTNLDLLNGMDRRLTLNIDDKAVELKRYRGLKVGSIEENNNNEGNWDKEIEVKILKGK